MRDSDKWKKAGMIYNRFSKVKAHRKLMAQADAPDLDIEGVRAILKELINAAVPIGEDEAEVIKQIESEQPDAGQQPA